MAAIDGGSGISGPLSNINKSGRLVEPFWRLVEGAGRNGEKAVISPDVVESFHWRNEVDLAALPGVGGYRDGQLSFHAERGRSRTVGVVRVYQLYFLCPHHLWEYPFPVSPVLRKEEVFLLFPGCGGVVACRGAWPGLSWT